MASESAGTYDWPNPAVNAPKPEGAEYPAWPKERSGTRYVEALQVRLRESEARLAACRDLLQRYLDGNKPYWSDNVRGRILCSECSGSWNYQAPEERENHDADCLYAAMRDLLMGEKGATA